MSTPTQSPVQNAPQLFDFKGAEVRTMTQNGEPWFVLADVCKVLEISQPHRVATRLNQADVTRSTVTITQVNGESATKSMNYVNESGLYDVILDSRKPEAKEFRRWITSEVIPSIRKHGAYLTSEKIEEVLLNPDTIIQIAQNLKEEQQARLEAERKTQEILEREEAFKKENQPKIEAFDALIAKGESEMVGTVGKTLGIGQNKLFQFLRDEEILISKGQRKNIPYQKYAKHFDVKQRLVKTWDGKEIYQATTYVKPSGMNFIRKRLAKAGIIK